ncbi:MAG TPA: enoyl-CoA hydratase-related protein [Acidobacteriaceae bacterium]|nr:enoyl-CoA hydratase-related protein [Acidobacteriaceae bacterium]
MAIKYATLEIRETDRVHTITLNRPERRNALSPQMIAELIHALGEAGTCDCGVVVLTGAGTAFCSGMDLESLKSLTHQRPEDQRADAESTMWMMRRLYDLTKPTIAAVNGPAIAGGTGLATLCDFTLAAPQARLGYTEVKIGFIPAMVSVFLLEMVGEKTAKSLLLSGRILDAREALALGLITEIVPDGQLMTRAYELAAMLLKNSPESMSTVKKLLSSFAKERLDRDLARAMRWNEKIRNSPDFREGLQAFLEKREPVWPGRKNK